MTEWPVGSMRLTVVAARDNRQPSAQRLRCGAHVFARYDMVGCGNRPGCVDDNDPQALILLKQEPKGDQDRPVGRHRRQFIRRPETARDGCCARGAECANRLHRELAIALNLEIDGAKVFHVNPGFQIGPPPILAVTTIESRPSS
jgi:hypothetical protein